MCSIALKFFSRLIDNKYFRFAAIIFFAGFFLGYTMRLFDFITAPVFSRVGVLYPIHNEARHHAYMEMGIAAEKSGIITENLGSQVDALYVMRNNIVSSFMLVTAGAVFAVPGVFMTFLVGMSVGASFPEVVEFLPAGLAVKTSSLAVLYILAVLISASIGFEIGKMMLDFVRQKRVRVNKSLYNRFVVLLSLILINMVLQYVLLVMK